MDFTKPTTFLERFKSFVEVTDPRTLIYSNTRVLQAQKELKENPEKLSINERELNEKIVKAAIHPVTGEIIPRPFRVSAIAPVNIPLVFFMIACPASNVPGTLFLHWLNQSYNTACNYANRSGADQSNVQLLKAYSLAVSSACAIAYGLGKVVANGPKFLRGMGILIPCIATASANISNIGFTRMDEIVTGVSLMDSTGAVHGTSSKAGYECVKQSALTRCVLVPMSCLLIPPAVMNGLKAIRLLPSNSTAKLALELGTIFLALQGALPAALAVYPSTAKFHVSHLEPKFQGLKSIDGKAIDYLYANKGL